MQIERLSFADRDLSPPLPSPWKIQPGYPRSRGILHANIFRFGNMQSLPNTVPGSWQWREREPVYNKAQYPRISLSCIFNDFLGDFGRSALPNRGGAKRDRERGERERGEREKKRPRERRNWNR